KHRGLAAASAAALIALGALGVVALRARWQAAAQAELARRFGEATRELDGLARAMHLSPLHDVRAEQAELRRRMDDIAAQARRGGGLAVGPGHYAGGRGHLLLDEPEAARVELGAAWDAGYHTPEVAQALGQALGELFRARRARLARIPDAAQRKAAL